MPIPRNIALVSQAPAVGTGQVMQIAAALQKQAEHFRGVWQVQAAVSAFDALEQVPAGYWPVIICDKDLRPDLAGAHQMDTNNQPYALVRAAGNISHKCSHEMLEMLADPFCNRLVYGLSPKAGQGQVGFLVEVCDPCAHASNGYSIDNLLVCDFYTPDYFDDVAVPGRSYSYNHNLTTPKQVLPGGYLSWQLAGSHEWWQCDYLGIDMEFRNRGLLPTNGAALRRVIDSCTQIPEEDTGLEGMMPDDRDRRSHARMLQQEINGLFRMSGKAPRNTRRARKH